MIKKRVNKINWHGNDLDNGKAKAPSIATQGGDGLDGLNAGEIYICDADEDPAIFIKTNKEKVARISGGGEIESYTKEQIDEYLKKKLDQVVWDRNWVEKKDPNGIEYIFTTKPIVTAAGVTMYSGDTPYLPSMFEGIPLDGETLAWVDGKIAVVGGIGQGGITGINVTGTGNAVTGASLSADGLTITLTKGSEFALKSDIPSLGGYATQSWVNTQLGSYATTSALKNVSDKLNNFLEGTDTDGIINKWKELENFLAGQTQTSTLAQLLSGKADKATTLAGYGITDAYTKTEINTVLGDYVTTAGAQDITGVKSFINGMNIGDISVKKHATGVIEIDGDLIVTGGITMYAQGSHSASTILDALPIDPDTLSKEGGMLSVIGGVGGGSVDGIILNGVTISPDDTTKLITLPNLVTVSTDQDITGTKTFSKTIYQGTSLANRRAVSYVDGSNNIILADINNQTIVRGSKIRFQNVNGSDLATINNSTLYANGNIIGSSYIKTTNGWFQNDNAGQGIMNVQGDARWYYETNFGGWKSDKPISAKTKMEVDGNLVLHTGNAVEKLGTTYVTNITGGNGALTIYNYDAIKTLPITANWPAARTFSIVDKDNYYAGTSSSVNGSANVILHLPEIVSAKSFTANNKRFNECLAFYNNPSPSVTGTICITLPNGWNSSMNIYEIYLYEYNNYAASVITVGAYNYLSSSPGWVNYRYHTKGAYNKGVRLAYNGSKCVILLGNTTTVWNYPQVYLKSVFAGYNNIDKWTTGYSIGVITSESGYSYIAYPSKSPEYFGDVHSQKFIRDGSSDAYVLLGGGGHKALSTIASENDAKYVTSLDTSGDYLTWTKNGVTSNIGIPYAGTASALRGYWENSVIRNPETQKLIYVMHIGSSTAGVFPTNSNANGIITLNTHEGNYTHQLGFSGNGNLYHRSFYNEALNTSKTWVQLLTTGNYTDTLDGRYYTESEADARFVNATGDTMTGILTISSSLDTKLYLKSGDSDNYNLIQSISSSNTVLSTLGYYGSFWGINGNVIWHAGNDGSGSGLDADLLDGYQRSNLYDGVSKFLTTVGNTISITVAGDLYTYYPVYIEAAGQYDRNIVGYLSIHKALGTTTANYPGNHSNGTSTIWFAYEWRTGVWDGNGGYLRTMYAFEGYASLVSEVAKFSPKAGVVIWLRGGGTYYEISYSNGRPTATIYYSATNISTADYPVNIAPRTDIGNAGVFYGPSMYTDIQGSFGRFSHCVSSANIKIESNSDGWYDTTYIHEINDWNHALSLQHHTSQNTFMCHGGGNVDIGNAGTSFKLNVNGGIYTNEYIRANNGLYIEGLDVYYSNVNRYASISSAANEICIDGRDNEYLSVNYRKGVTGYAPKIWYWRAGSSSSWADFNIGALHANGTSDINGILKCGQGLLHEFNHQDYTIRGRRALVGAADALYIDYLADWNTIYMRGSTIIINGNGITCDNWLRTTGNTGWYSQTYNGGIYMTDTTYVRVYNGKSFYVPGNILATGGVTMYSDLRKKNVIKEILLPLESMAKADLFDYIFKSDEKGIVRAGTSAQYWNKYLPEVVSKDNEDFFTMDYGVLATVCSLSLAKHFHDFLNNEFHTHETEIEKLKRENRDMKKRIEELERRVA